MAAQTRDLLANLEWAVANCTERDVDTDAVRQTLEHIRTQADKGPMLVARWQKGHKIIPPKQRQNFFAQTYQLIVDQLGG